ncbi:homocitrate synthase/isopropylmalate synthase family protein, partial [Staphylococcus epidermidis]
MGVRRNKGIVGENGFSDEWGIDEEGVVKDGETYEMMRREVVGV